MEVLILKLNFCFTLYMTGLIWFVQVVHYPLFGQVGRADFLNYERRHTQLTFWVTAPTMILELITAAGLVYLALGNGLYWINFTGALLLWGVTFFVQVPLHNTLSQRHDPAQIQRLVRSNWIRTALWSLRAILLFILL